MVPIQSENGTFDNYHVLTRSKRVDIKNRSEIPGPNKYGRKGTLICGQCRARNSKVTPPILALLIVVVQLRQQMGTMRILPGS